MAHLVRQEPRHFTLLTVVTLLVTGLLLSVHSVKRAQATSGGNPYSVSFVTDTNPDPNIVETTLVAEAADVDIGGGVTAHAQTFNGQIPGPTFRLKVGDTVIVHFENHLDRETGIHWHGIELSNTMDGTPFTQNQVQPGGKFLYKFKVSRPGIYWYHPHHHASTNQVFKGLYGMILIKDPNDAALVGSGTLPSAANTLPIVLSDMTVCHDPGGNDPFGGGKTYDPALPWVGPLDPLPAPQTGNETGALPAQASPHPLELCETEPIDVDGNDLPAGTTFHEGDIPNNQTLVASGRTNEGQTVLTNGMNVGGRGGKPTAPGALAGGAFTYPVAAGQGLRLEMLNAATTRFMRLRLTDQGGATVPLVRVGGEGGLIDDAVIEGGVIGGFDTKIKTGELLLDPGSRADVVVAIPASAASGDVLTMWTEDMDRTGMHFSNVPTVPVMHLAVTGSVAPFSIGAATPLRSATGDPVAVLGGPISPLLDQTTFIPPKVGFVPNAQNPPNNPDRQSIRLTQTGGPAGLGINDVFGTHDVSGDYSVADHLESTRYAKIGDTLELFVVNTTGGAHHPYHLHGFSMQPIALIKTAGGGPDYVWPYHEFRDNIDVPPGYTLKFRTKLEDRALADGTTPGGVLGRWLFHCHIFFHATNGMLGEVVVVDANGNEKPDVNADTTSVDVNEGSVASATGTFSDIDSDAVTLTASKGTVTDTGGGHWSWSFTTTNGPTESGFVYVTATDSTGKKDEAVFFLKVNNVPPTVTITSPPANSVFVAPALVTVDALVADPGSGDTETCTFNWAGGGPNSGDVAPAGGTCSQSNTFTVPGTYTITVTADDGDGGVDADTVTIKIVTAMSLKQDALAQATALLAGTTVKQDQDKLQKAIDRLTTSLDPANWIDGNRIKTANPAGNKVFENERDAVKQLMNLIKDHKGPISEPAVQEMIDEIVFADRILAQVAIDDAIAGGGDARKIAAAQEELTKAADQLAKGNFDTAIDHYKNAWNKAKQA